MDKEKKPPGRPPVPPEERLLQRSIRLTAKQWAKFDASGGIDWLRALIDKAKGKKAE